MKTITALTPEIRDKIKEYLTFQGEHAFYNGPERFTVEGKRVQSRQVLYFYFNDAQAGGPLYPGCEHSECVQHLTTTPPTKNEEQHINLDNPAELRLAGQVRVLERENQQLRQQLKSATLESGIFQELKDELEISLEPLIPNSIEFTPTDTVHTEHLVMHLSDEHADQIVHPESVGNLERYDFNIALRRAERYVDKVLDYTQSTLRHSYTFPVLWVLAYGDHTSGEIHGAMARSEFRNQFRNCLAIGQMHALMLHDLAPYFQKVNVLYLSGNHGRRSLKKDFNGPKDNWDYLVGAIAEQYCREHRNIQFLIPDSFSAVININGHNFCVFHGDDIKSWGGIPHYGIERKTQRLAALLNTKGQKIRYFVMGHFHRPATTTQVDGEIIVNGTWVGTDPYAYNSLAGYTEPSQWIHGVHEKQGVSWRLKVGLKGSDDQYGPQRYKVRVP